MSFDWVYILKFIYGFIHDLRNWVASRVQEICRKLNFNVNRWICRPMHVNKPETHLFLLQINFVFVCLNKNHSFLVFKIKTVQVINHNKFKTVSSIQNIHFKFKFYQLFLDLIRKVLNLFLVLMAKVKNIDFDEYIST